MSFILSFTMLCIVAVLWIIWFQLSAWSRRMQLVDGPFREPTKAILILASIVAIGAVLISLGVFE